MQKKSVLDKKFEECNATVEISTEIEQLKNILINKCKMPEGQVNTIINYCAKNSSNYLLMLYQAFGILRGDLSKGVFKEANANLQDQTKYWRKKLKIQNQ